jgi:hypothetical protein
MLRRLLSCVLLLCLTVPGLQAHELPQRVGIRMFVVLQEQSVDILLRVPLEAMRDVDFPLTPEGYLRIADAAPALREAAGLWVVDAIALREEGQALPPTDWAARLALPGDRGFDSPAAAQAQFAGPPLAADTQLYWRQAMLDVRIRYALARAAAPGALTLDAALRQLGGSIRVDLLLVNAAGDEHLLRFDGDVRDLALLPTWWGVALEFLREGFVHILGGLDHLLFLVCLVLPLRRFWPLLQAITAFTVAHSLTLAAAALDWVPQALWFPSLVEFVIALSIVFLAVENALRSEFRWRWVTAFVFGLAHGFGFAGLLRETLQFAQGQQLVALAAFNLGVEFGQLAVLALLLPLLLWLLRRTDSERVTVMVVSLIVAHTGWHWMSDRFELLRGYFF